MWQDPATARKSCFKNKTVTETQIFCIRRLPIYIALALFNMLTCVSTAPSARSISAEALEIKVQARRLADPRSYNLVGFKLAVGLRGVSFTNQNLEKCDCGRRS